jgi:hypothetical protein
MEGAENRYDVGTSSEINTFGAAMLRNVYCHISQPRTLGNLLDS